LKVTLIVQLAPAATLVPQLLVSPKSSETSILETARAAVPLLVNVTVCGALVVPTACDPNESEVGEKLAEAVGASPVPVRWTSCEVLLVALSVIVKVPVRVPAAVGVQVTLIVQLAPAFTLLPQLFVSPNSSEAAIFEIRRVAAPVFVRVTVCGALVVPTV